jgi:cell division topological specificity factor
MAWTALQRWFGGHRGNNRETGKARLQMILQVDRLETLGLTPDKIEAMRKDILETISRYIAIDSDRVKVDVQYEHTPAEVVINAPMISRPASVSESPKS